jgi:membrane associated rhomboid family serine protease
MNSYFKILPVQPKKRSWFIRFFGSWFSNLNVTGWLIALNVVIFIVSLFFMASDLNCSSSFCLNTALQPNNLFNNGYWWTLLTSMFMHAGFFHLFVNMFSLYFLGTFLERIIGKKRFLGLYVVSGLFAGIFFSLLAFIFGNGIGARLFGSPETFAVGASGAIFAIAGVLALLTPRNKVYIIMGPLLAIIFGEVLGAVIGSSAINNLIGIILSIYVFISIFAMFSINPAMRKIALPLEIRFWAIPLIAIVPLFLVSLFLSLPIGNSAHLGGFIAGALYGLFLRIKYKKKTKAISAYFSK